MTCSTVAADTVVAHTANAAIPASLPIALMLICKFLP